MPSPKIDYLTTSQEKLIFSYREKWRSIERCTASIDEERATSTLRNVYRSMSFQPPQILFYRDPYEAIDRVSKNHNYRHFLGRPIKFTTLKYLFETLYNGVRCQLTPDLLGEISHRIVTVANTNPDQYPEPVTYLNRQLSRLIQTDVRQGFQTTHHFSDYSYLAGQISYPSFYVSTYCLLDFCFSELDLFHDSYLWARLKDLAEHCGSALLFQNICVHCDRPSKILADEYGRIHADDAPAIEYASGYGIRACHGYHPSELQDPRLSFLSQD